MKVEGSADISGQIFVNTRVTWKTSQGNNIKATLHQALLLDAKKEFISMGGHVASETYTQYGTPEQLLGGYEGANCLHPEKNTPPIYRAFCPGFAKN
jgi:hypothetical protein